MLSDAHSNIDTIKPQRVGSAFDPAVMTIDHPQTQSIHPKPIFRRAGSEVDPAVMTIDHPRTQSIPTKPIFRRAGSAFDPAVI